MFIVFSSFSSGCLLYTTTEAEGELIKYLLTIPRLPPADTCKVGTHPTPICFTGQSLSSPSDPTTFQFHGQGPSPTNHLSASLDVSSISKREDLVAPNTVWLKMF